MKKNLSYLCISKFSVRKTFALHESVCSSSLWVGEFTSTREAQRSKSIGLKKVQTNRLKRKPRGQMTSRHARKCTEASNATWNSPHDTARASVGRALGVQFAHDLPVALNAPRWENNYIASCSKPLPKCTISFKNLVESKEKPAKC